MIIIDIAHKIGASLKIDGNTLDGDFGHYARVFVDVDLDSLLQQQFLLDCENNLIDIDVACENISSFYSICHPIGHHPYDFRFNKEKVD